MRREEKQRDVETKIDDLYVEIGKKIKGWARRIFAVGAVASVVYALGMLFNMEDVGSLFSALAVLVFGPMLAWVSSWVLYAFGELVDKTVANEGNTRAILKLMQENKE